MKQEHAGAPVNLSHSLSPEHGELGIPGGWI